MWNVSFQGMTTVELNSTNLSCLRISASQHTRKYCRFSLLKPHILAETRLTSSLPIDILSTHLEVCIELCLINNAHLEVYMELYTFRSAHGSPTNNAEKWADRDTCTHACPENILIACLVLFFTHTHTQTHTRTHTRLTRQNALK